ncbi:UPF0182 family protein [Brooklawnia cerclae]|uniref:UPF0182 protein FB473_001025 n=1 Tax=Brooklawnia cerclae TaxID=349934 RepID=A0ABX0SED8_9ACTN|nr:UPF0182 family protein [Brooklawnia cerclae]NIH56380.1 hypothetical protein [Brooklawnia cerclae]
MSSLVEEDPTAPRKRNTLALTLGILVVLILGFVLFSRVWTDLLWYRSVDAQQVFTIRLFSTVGLFCVFGLLMAVVVLVNMVVALRMRPHGVPAQAGRSSTLSRYRRVMDARTKLFVAVPVIVLGLLAGAGAVSVTDTFLAWLNATPFGTTDPYFNRDISFYVFDLPWWRFVVSQVMWTFIISLVATAVVHFISGATRTSPLRLSSPVEGQAPEIKVSNPFGASAQAHMSVLLGIIMILIGIDQMLGRYAFAYTDNDTLFTGIGYTDDHARITAKLIMAIICLVCAVVFFVNAKLRRWMLPTSAVALAVASSLVVQVAYPGLVWQFDVKPNEPDRERNYIANQISATREAYGVADVEVTDYSATTTVSAGQLIADASALPGIRLMDPQVIAPTFEQLQQVRGYYTFPDVLDVDRYTIDGQETDAIVAVREINTSGLPEENQTWNNVHTVYTHGYAMVGAYGNRRQASGEPEWIERDIPPEGELNQVEPRVYFGENTTDYSIVGTTEGGSAIELDTPGGESGSGETYTTYSGTGGVSVGNYLVRALFAARFGDINLLLSSRVTSESKILYDRTPAERVAKVAPWLTIDQDPYPAVVDGRVVWIIDGYTTSNSYPNSQRVDLSSATSDSTSSWTPVGSESSDVNYIRNSVKAVVDAYDGTVTLYAWDTSDPVLQTWDKVYPGLLHSVDEISDDLKAHLRYPQDLFKAQREILGRYHMTDPMAWYQQSDLWVVPDDPRYDDTKEPPYYLSIKWPEDDAPVFSQTAVYVPRGRENLGAYMAVVADAASPDYGKIRVLRLSDTHQVPGPNQTFNAIQTDEQVQQALLPFTSQGAAEPVYGNLLTLPLGGGLIYVEPIYTQGKATGSYPVLRFIVVRFGDHIGIGDTLQEALDTVFQGDAGVDTGEGSDQTSGGSDEGSSSGTTTGSEAVKAALEAAVAAYDAADEALKAGDLAEYQAQIEIAKQRVEEAQSALG